jgi:hypothetical protein
MIREIIRDLIRRVAAWCDSAISYRRGSCKTRTAPPEITDFTHNVVRHEE